MLPFDGNLLSCSDGNVELPHLMIDDGSFSGIIDVG